MLHPPAEYLAATDGTLPDIEYRLRTDANGFIVLPDSESHCDESVIFPGDSFVESIYVPEELRFPAAVQTALRARGHSVRCLDGGYSGATTLHLLLSVLGKVGRTARTSMILIVPSNDAPALAKSGGYWCMDDARYSPVVPVPRNSKAGSRPFDNADLTTILNLFVDACRRLRLPLTLATLPHRTVEFDANPWLQRRFVTASNYARVRTALAKVNDSVRAVARRLAVPLIDLDGMLSAQTQFFYDDLHLNIAGSEHTTVLVVETLSVQRIATPIAAERG